MVSSDSETWRLATGSGLKAGILPGMSYSSALGRWLSPVDGTSIYSSTDRDNWTNAGAPVGPTPYYNLAAGPDQFVGTGNSGGIYRSADGNTWTAAANSGFTGNDLRAVRYGGGTYVAIGDNSTMARSADGDTWTTVRNWASGWPWAIMG